ncbi:MAG: CoA-binding protein [Desulfomonile tiedjei]|uniref:CoA-binding protein n=1 Tax=Desulfomonile tiedjei TaxID=2358 RepID=A0A9D6V1Z0_9BACT|nr:CoA-binding protein [Desulfomonile tiedjei]
MNEFAANPLFQIMHPKSIAFWGASNNPLGMGSVQLSQLLAMGFEGSVFPMHPREVQVMGLKAYMHAKDLPVVPDLAIFVLPTAVVPDILEECGQAGIKRAIIVSAGFGEMGPEGRALQDRLVETARKYDIVFIGPNCIGVVNPHLKLNTTFFPYDASPGFIGIASQSGSFVTQMFVHLEKFGIGFSQGFSVGNEALVDIADCLEYLGKCPDTKVIALYIEAIRRGRDFFRVAKEVSKIKPIVAFYVGGSESGKRAAHSHTGAMAGPDLLYDGIFKQAGIIRAASIEELFDLCMVLGSQPLPEGDRIAILTHSGGPGAAAADTAERSGLKLAHFSAETVNSLMDLVPHTASVSNPVDLTFNRNPSDYTKAMPQILLKDEQVDSLFMYLLIPLRRVMQAIAATGADPENAALLADVYLDGQTASVAELSANSGKPVVGASFCTRGEPFIRKLQDSGVPVLTSPERAIKALAALTNYARAKRAMLEQDDAALQ